MPPWREVRGVTVNGGEHKLMFLLWKQFLFNRPKLRGKREDIPPLVIHRDN